MKLTDIQPGDTIIADGGFTCMRAGPTVVQADNAGLYVKCSEGRHYLDGQEDEAGELIGLSAAP